MKLSQVGHYCLPPMLLSVASSPLVHRCARLVASAASSCLFALAIAGRVQAQPSVDPPPESPPARVEPSEPPPDQPPAPAAPHAPTEDLAPAPTEDLAPTPTQALAPAPTGDLAPAPAEDLAPAPTDALAPVASPAEVVSPAAPPAREDPPREPSPAAAPAAPQVPERAPWYERVSIRGYAQFRYNGLPSFDENDSLINLQGDRYMGEGAGIGMRRARVILYGDVHEQVYVYFQPDFASSIGEQNHVAIVRDWYADLAFDRAKTFRVRVGQSKVPFGFENMQSSQNRLALDRNDALNSAVKDERDLGAFFYWAPTHIRTRFRELVSSGLKGSGDYGVAALGVYNGQTANRFDRNDNLHVVTRLTWPFLFGEQFVEIGGGAYHGLYRVNVAEEDDGTSYTTSSSTNDLVDQRAFVSLSIYPQPIGFQAEYNVGRGPQQGEDDPTLIESRPLHGGYAQAMLKLDDVLYTQALIPFVRGTLYQGGKKFVTNAPRYDVKELELGLECQLIPAAEVVFAYLFADRTSDRYPYNQERGQVTRVQVQVNF